MFRYKPFGALLLGLLLSLTSSLAMAQTKIHVGYTTVVDLVSAFAAQEQGYFKAHGLDVDLTLITLGSTVPAALQSDSIDIGAVTPSVMLQAVDSGIDLVGIVGGNATYKGNTSNGLLVRTGTDIKSAPDLIGKRVAVPSLNAYFHVLLRRWLQDKGVDYKKVKFVEIAFPQMGDLLHSGAVDAAVTVDPFMTRIIESKNATLFAYYIADLPPDETGLLFASTRKWADKNPVALAAFRAAVIQGAEFSRKNPALAVQYVAKYLKLPPEALKSVQFGGMNTDLNESSFKFWEEVMKQQGMLRNPLDTSKLIAK